VFTGIIEELGVIRAVRQSREEATLTISAPGIAASLKIGESVAVNGACLTVVSGGDQDFTCELTAETLERTDFRRVREGLRVNLERSLLAGSRLGGHFVQGHVDGVGRYAGKEQSGRGAVVRVEFPKELERYLVYKGSIAVDGISLTIASLEETSFCVAVIPHTVQSTNMKYMSAGDPVNLEVDILGKYLDRFFQLRHSQERTSKLSAEYLKEQGF